MQVLKMGFSHAEIGMNCQDAVVKSDIMKSGLKIVCDGCSEGKHSEVGANLFCQIFAQKYEDFFLLGKKNIDIPALMYAVIDELFQLIGNNPQTIKDFLSFTSLVAFENSVYYCGDGYIVLIKNENEVHFQKLDCGEYPKYLSYNYLPQNCMKEYKDGVKIEVTNFSDEYKVGVASDGIRFIVERDENDPLRKEFKNIILSDSDMKMKMFFNRNEKIFKDDFSIVI